MPTNTPNLSLVKPGTDEFYNVGDQNGNMDILDTAVSGKVDKVAGKGLSTEDYTTAEKNKLANLSKTDVGLANVDNVKQMPIAGGTFTGVAVAQSNASYTTAQLRNVILSTADPSGGNNGDIWVKYE